MKKAFLLSILILLSGTAALAQSIDALGTVWSKEYGSGMIRNIKPVKYGGGYVACGNRWNSATEPGTTRCEGLLIEIDESGNELRRATAFPDSYINSHSVEQMLGAEAWFIAAFKTNDGGYLAFGQLKNSTAPSAEKEFQWPYPAYGSPELINGTWIVKFDEDLNIVKNVIVRGRKIYEGWQMEDDNFIVAGHQAAPSQSAPATSITMLRKYDQDGELLIPGSHNDSPIDLGFVITLYKYPGIDKFIGTTTKNVLGINQTMNVSDTLVLTAAIMGGGANIYSHSLSPTVEGGAFVGAYRDAASEYSLYSAGSSLLKLNLATKELVYRKLKSPADTLFYAPMLLSDTYPYKYIGSMRIKHPTVPSTYREGYYMYELTDYGDFFTYRVGDEPYPNNTNLKLTGQIDGFFSVGQSLTENTAIAKLSTCSNLELNVGETSYELPVDETIIFPERTATVEGNNGTVSWKWSLDDITPGGPAAIFDTPVQGTSATIPAHTFALSEGKTSAVVRFRITVTDDYGTGKCSQTKDIVLKLHTSPVISFVGTPNNLLRDNVNCQAEPTPFSFNFWRRSTHALNTSNQCIPLVGDLDGDGVVEIVAMTTDNGISIYNDFNSGSIFNATGYTSGSQHTSMVLCDVDNDGKAEIGVYKYLSGGITSFTLYENTSLEGGFNYEVRWTVELASGGSNYVSTLPVVADLNGDYAPEFVVCQYIIDKDGAIKATLPLGGRGLYGLGYPCVADFDNDGIPEIAVGTDIYKYNGTSASLWKRCPGFSSSVEGTNMAADINLDGVLDLVYHDNETNSVAPFAATRPSEQKITVWTPSTNAVIGTINNLATVAPLRSYTVIGDIDGGGNKNPEICFTGFDPSSSGGIMAAYKFTGSGFVQKWQMPTNRAAATGFTLFDFNLDGVLEIVYRDATHLRIINGSNDFTTPIDHYAQSSTSSGAGIETPIIVDVDGDGVADILVANNNDLTLYWPDYSAFPSCPPVWNQQLYSNLLIDTNLSVIGNVSSPALATSCNGEVMRHYNGGPMQVPYLSSETFCPINLAVDLYIESSEIKYLTSTTAEIKLTIGNKGYAKMVRGGFCVRYYANDLTFENTIDYECPWPGVNPGNTTEITKTVTFPEGTTQLYVRVLDNGGSFPSARDCNPTDNVTSFGLLELSNSVNWNNVCPGGSFIFTIRLVNDSENTYNNIVITDSIGGSIIYLSHTVSEGSSTEYEWGDGLSWTLSNFAPGDTAYLHISAGVDGTYNMNKNYAWISSVNGVPVVDREIKEAYVIVNKISAKMPAFISPAEGGKVCGENGVMLSTSQAAEGMVYKWYRDLQEIKGATEQNYYATLPGNYTVSYYYDKCNSYPSNPVVLEKAEDCPEEEEELKAINDDISILNGNALAIDVLGNDIIPAGCTPTVVYNNNATRGTAQVSNGKILYTPSNPDFEGRDSLTYTIQCATGSSTAKVYIIMRKAQPDNVSDISCFVDAPAMEWGIVQDWKSTETDVAVSVVPLVGDMNNDSVPEIVVYTTAGRNASASVFGASRPTLKTIAIYDTRTQQQVRTISLPSTISEYEIDTYGMINTPDHGTLIIVPTIDFKLHAYDYSGTEVWTSDVDYGSVAGDHSAAIGFADFNHDGIPEAYINNKIYNANTGKLLAVASGGTNRGAAYACASGNAGWKQSASTAADVLGTDTLQLILGNEIYAARIHNINGTEGNSLTKVKSISPPDGVIVDGHTQVADFNRDGFLDVFISNRTTAGGAGTAHGYVWDVHNNTVSEPFAIATGNYSYGGKSIPLIADFDGDAIPDVLIQTQLSGTNDALFRAFKYNHSSKSFSTLWSYTPNEDSYSTSATLFDFNLDGVPEIVLQDQAQLGIVNATTGALHTSLTFGAATVMQFPIVADPYGVAGDQSARIISIGKFGSAGFSIYSGSLNVLKAVDGHWAYARPVWNQIMYNSVNVNADVSVAQYPMNPATFFAGNDGNMNTNDDVQPFNSFLKQMEILNVKGEPLWLAPSAAHAGQPTLDYDAVADKLTITVMAQNIGDTPFQSPFMITAYKGAVGSTPKFSYSHSGTIAAGATAAITFNIPNFKADWTSWEGMIIRLNDAGNSYNNQIVCDSTRRDISVLSKNLFARDDRVSVLVNSLSNRIPVTLNDSKTCAGEGSFDVEIVEQPKHGTSTVNDSALIYKPDDDFAGLDSVKYRLLCSGEIDSAMVYINVIRLPDNVIDDPCASEPSPTPWTIQKLTEYAGLVNHYLIPMVGDIDNDGKVEIITGRNDYGSTAMHNLDKLNIFKVTGNTLQTPQILNLGAYINTVASNMGIASVDGDGYAAIFVATSTFGEPIYAQTSTKQAADHQRKLVKYVYNGTNYVLYKAIADCPQYSTVDDRDAAQPMFADFNGDGIPEVVLLDKVYNAQTLELLADGGILNNTFPTPNYEYGLGYGGHINNTQNNNSTYKTSHMVLADMDNDGVPEIVAGHCVYKVNLTNISGTGGNTFSLWSKCDGIGPEGETHAEVRDGATAVADIDGDGFLDVIVSGHATTTNNGAFFIWNPRTKHVMHTTIYNNLPSWVSGGVVWGGPSRPLAGDVDGDGVPEIVFLTSPSYSEGKLYCMKYDRTAKTLSVSWTFANSDNSASTTLTLFDFNNDGKAELVYRDDKFLYIIDGTTGTQLSFFSGLSNATANEYPLIVDINDDNHAEIVTTGEHKLQIFSSDPPGNWASARRVWNQVPYNAVNVNEDLTVPRNSFNPATLFPGSDGIFGTTDDLYPFNNFLQQQTTLDANGNPSWIAPSAEHAAIPTLSLNAETDVMTVTVKAHNMGDAAFAAPFMITVYKGAVGSTLRHTYSHPAPIYSDATVTITFTIPDFMATWASEDDLIVRLNDAGNGYNYQAVCDSTRRDASPSNLHVLNDTVSVLTNSSNNRILVTVNDIKACVGEGTFSIAPIGTAKHGTLTVADSALVYTPTAGFNGIDSAAYYIKCGTDSSAAKVYIAVVKPGALSYIACQDVSITLSVDAAGASMFWYSQQTGGAPSPSGAANTKTVTKNAADTEVFWVEPRYGTIKFPRYKLELLLSAICGITDPTGCAANGSLIWKEDFGGNDANDDRVSQTGLPDGMTDIQFSSDNTGYGYGMYWLLKYNDAGLAWYKNFSDHTHPGDNTRGYFYMLDPGNGTNQRLYRHKLKGLCGGDMFVSLWALELNPYNSSSSTLTFTLLDSLNNVVASFTSSKIPMDPSGPPKWRNFGFPFTVPAGYDSLTLEIHTDTPLTSNGYDFALDDIEVRLCITPITILQPLTANPIACEGETVTFIGDFTGTEFDYDRTAKWQYSATGNINKPDEWVDLESQVYQTISKISAKIEIIAAADKMGYYRMIAADPARIDMPNCRVSSKVIYLEVQACPTSDLVAVNDTVTTIANTPITINALANDSLYTCSVASLDGFDTVPNFGLKHGKLTINPANGSLLYTPDIGFNGIDSAAYYIKCGTDSSAAKVYIAVVKPGALTYIACQGVSVSLSVEAAGAEMFWFTQPTGGVPISIIPANIQKVSKSAASSEVFWVEARYGTIKFPRYKVELLLSENCGITDPTGCAVDGSLIWKEDFGGNNATDDRVSQTGLPDGSTTLTFSPNNNGYDVGYYWLLKYNDAGSSWYKGFSDHTHPGDNTRGYFYMLDPSEGDPLLYRHKLKGLCGGDLFVSLWALELNANTPNSSSLTFTLLDSLNNVVASFTSSKIPMDPSGPPKWRNFGFLFTVPAGYDSLTLEIHANANYPLFGYDFALDDIEVRLCLPPVTITQPATGDSITACEGTEITLAGEFINDGTFDNDYLMADWQYSPTGDVNDPSGWVPLPTATTTPSTGEITAETTFISDLSSTGYYRLIVADAANISQPNCRASSKLIYLEVQDCETSDLEAVNDTVTTIANTPITINVLANDSLYTCSVSSLNGFDTVPNFGLKHGKLTINSANGSLLYTPNVGFNGIDSAAYYIKCGTDSSAAKVYIAVVKPGALNYIACQDISVTLSVEAAGAGMFWFTQQTGGSPNPGNAINTKSVTKSAASSEVFWVEPRYGTIKYPRYKVELLLSENCGITDPTNCAANGSLIWNEDFGGNNATDDRVSQTGLPDGATTLTFSPNNNGYDQGKYWLLKYNDKGPAWYKNFSDHTHPGDNTRGYFYMLDPSAGNQRLYRHKLKGLCEGNLFVSLWALELNAHNTSSSTLVFTLLDSLNNVVASFTSSKIPMGPDDPPKWRNFGFPFTVPAGYDSLTLEIHTNTPSPGSGFDFALDDIEVRLCITPITVVLPSTENPIACEGETVTFDGDFTGEEFSGDRTAKWQYSATGNINKPDEWVNLETQVHQTYGHIYAKVDIIAAADKMGYYRMIVADAARIDMPNCRASSKLIYLEVQACPTSDLVAVNDTITTIANTPITINVLANDSLYTCSVASLSGFDTVPNFGLKHGKLTINSANGSLLYTPNVGFNGIDSAAYYIKCGADSSAAKVYIAVVKPGALSYIACQGVSITLSVEAAGADMYWYSQQSGGSPNPNSAINTKTLVKSAASSEVFWVEPRYGSIRFPRYKLELLRNTDCGSTIPPGCAADGSLIWNEDFDRYDDGLNPASNVRSTEELPAGMTTYAFGVPGQAEGEYSLLKRGSYGWEITHFTDDHTSPGNNTIGRFLLVNGKGTADQVYKQEIQDLYTNTSLYFSFWAAGSDALFRLTIYSADDNSVLSVCEFPALNSFTWNHYGFTFQIPDGVSSIYFDFYNYCTSLGGNDFAIDDIEVRLCMPPITITQPSTDLTVCEGTSVTFAGEFENNGVFENSSLTALWQYHPTGDINDPDAWTPLTTTVNTVESTVTASATFNAALSATGYYRMIAADAANIDRPNSRASSKLVYLEVQECTTSDFKAMNDTVTTSASIPITVNVLANDRLNTCSVASLAGFDTVPNFGLKHGTLTIDPVGKTLTYAPNAGFNGIDSAAYYIKCETDSSAAKVYIAVVKPGARSYIACENASVTLSAEAAGADMYWFTQPTEGTPDPAIATNTKTLVKSAAPTEVYWVEPRYGSIRFPRYRLELLLNENCGITDPTDCAVDGTLIWKEDFGGNDPAAPRISATGLPTGQTNYTYSSNDGVWTHGQYGLVKYSDFNGSNNWHSGFSDHTFANDKTRGYMFMTDASATVDMLYQHKIKGLCGGNLHISLWTANLVKQSYAETQHPTFRIELLDSVNTVIASYVTNNIPQFASPSWVNYGFAASIPAGYDSLTLRIYSNTVGSNAGNDFVFDDIEVRLCLPPVTITQPSTTSDTAVCAGSSVTLTGEFTNSDDTFDDDNLVAQWQYHPTGDINDPDGWTSLTTITTTPSTGEITGSITFVAAYSSAGYYRLIAADVANIGKANCRASSKLIHLNVIQAQIPPDIRVYVKPSAALTAVSLSSYIDSLPYSYTVQWNPAAEFTNIVTGMLNISGWTVPMTKIYTYSIISASCGTQTAKAYIRTIDSYGTNQRTVFICKELLLNGKLNLSRIFGIETDGSMAWSYPSDPDNVILNNISVTATGIHAGSRIFNAAKAFNEAGIAYDYPIGMKQFIIDYESGTVKKTVNLIVY